MPSFSMGIMGKNDRASQVWRGSGLFDGRVLFQMRMVIGDGCAHQFPKYCLVGRGALENVDRSPRLSHVVSIEQAMGIGQMRAMGKCELHLALMRIADGDQPAVGPSRTAHPLPVFDDIWVAVQDNPSQLCQHGPAPVIETVNHLVDFLGCRQAQNLSPGSWLAWRTQSAN